MRLDHEADVVAPGPSTREAGIHPAGSRLDAIAARGVLRVAYLPDALPFAFHNAGHQLVGFDVALAHRLASDLHVGVQFVSVPREDLRDPSRLATALVDGQYDLALGGIAVTVARARQLRLSASYLSETIAFVVRDEQRARFESWESIRAAGPLTIAVPDEPYYADQLRDRLPQARLRPVPAVGRLFDLPGSDAIALPAERGSAWTLRYPQYSVVVPAPGTLQVPLAFALPANEPDLAALVDTWISLKRADGTLHLLYEYWILGRDAAPAAPRWSVLRDVLHWVR
jgi:ABC-type amino acid transport substrate-binding protein